MPLEAPLPVPPERRPPIQFSMATLMGAMTLIAIGLAVFLVLPYWIAILTIAIAQIGLLAFLIAGAFFGTGRDRTFCIGAVATQLLLLTNSAGSFGDSVTLWLRTSVSLRPDSVIFPIVRIMAVLFGGWVCVYARRFWERRDDAA